MSMELFSIARSAPFSEKAADGQNNRCKTAKIVYNRVSKRKTGHALERPAAGEGFTVPTPSRMEVMNGVWLTAVQTKRYKTACWAITLLAPLSAETAAQYAALPRVLLHGTASYPNRARLEEALLGLCGGRFSPVVRRVGEVQCVGLRGFFPDDRYGLDGSFYRETARLLGELLLHPATRNGRIPAEPVDEERFHLLDALAAERRDPLRDARRRLLEKLCRGEPYAVGALGTPAGAKRVTQVRLNRAYQELLPGVHIEVYYSGSLPPDAVCSAWREALRELPRSVPEEESGRIPDTLLRRPGGREPRVFSEPGEGAPLLTASLCVGGAIRGGRTLPLLVLEERLRRVPGVLETQLDSVKGLLLVQLSAGAEGLERLSGALDTLCRGELTEEALEETHRALARRFLALTDRAEPLAEYWLEQTAAERRADPEQAAALVYTVGREELAEAARLTEPDAVLLRENGQEESR